ncbi:MAG: metal ABC transporter permease [Lachnospiraceae bacterium]|nr:metal ABC transporter permease [Lachnospiraceae bacterium]
MASMISEMLSYPFLVRAFIVGSLVALCCALLGVSLVLKGFSMIGDGLSHVSFGAMTVAMALNVTPLPFALPIVVFAAFCLLKVQNNSKIKGDSAIALISSSALAIGLMAASLTTGLNSDVYSYMFGSILSMQKSDVILSVSLSVLVLFLFVFCYHKIFAITFDESFAKASGIPVFGFNMLLAFLSAVTIVLGMRMMGAMLISSLILFPCLISRQLFQNFLGVTICSGVLSFISFTIGMILSYQFDAPVSASIVLVNLFFLLFFMAIQKFIIIRSINKGYVAK